MTKLFIFTLLFIITRWTAFSQTPVAVIDSLKTKLAQTHLDTNRVLLLTDLAANYQFFKPDTALKLVRNAVSLAENLHYTRGKIKALTRLGEVLRGRGEYPQALEAHLMALKLGQQTHDLDEQAVTLSFAGIVYTNLAEYQQGLDYLLEAKSIYNQKKHLSKSEIAYFGYLLSNIGDAYGHLGRVDSAFYYQNQALALQSHNHVFAQPLQALILTRLGEIQQRSGETKRALTYYRQALLTAIAAGDILNMTRARSQIAEVYKLQHPDSSLHYARLAFSEAQRVSDKTTLLSTSSLLANLYRSSHNLDSAFQYQQVAMATKDSLFGPEKFRRLQLLALTEQQRIEQLRQEQEQAKERLQKISLVGILGVFLLIALFLWRNNRQQQRNNRVLSLKNKQIEAQRNTVEQTLTELKTTQAQLIQREKMASLGELTAGIAHEIQNPLNFVNNFSEVSTELVAELIGELNKGDPDEAKTLAGDLSQNLQKITLHGGRASAIVKGMLEHSRTSTGERQPTDLNALADEYLRLAYQGFRAKDKDFKSVLKTDFDADIGLVEVIPQEIGRVLLNLFNNAFYAVQQKQKQQPTNYDPTVSLSTHRENAQIEIRIKDNGMGIPASVKSKIFQPFFTTKPTGEGTGLGLSLSYDIVTKGHNGSLLVESQAGQGTEFVVQLPTKI